MRYLPLLLALCLTLPARADDMGLRLRTLAQKHAASVVTVAVTISVEDQRVEVEAEGLIIDSSGLVMTTNTAIDPLSSRPDSGGGDSGIVTNVIGAKIVLPGGVDVPARLMLRDKTRNVAFLRPLKPLNLPALPFAQSRAIAGQGDVVTLVGRLGKAGARTPAVENVRLLAVMDKPRTLYVLPISAMRLGEAVFNDKGELLGVVSMRIAPSSGRASLNETDRYVAVVIPCADIWTIALQTPPLKAAAKPATAKPATAKPAAKPAAKPMAKPATPKPAAQVAALRTTDLRVGTGPAAKAGDELTMNYRGTLLNGKMFDQSYGRGPFDFELGAGSVIEGWDKGIVGMKVGGKRRLVIPAKMAYGGNSPSPDIPANSTLVFEVELLAVNGKTK